MPSIQFVMTDRMSLLSPLSSNGRSIPLKGQGHEINISLKVCLCMRRWFSSSFESLFKSNLKAARLTIIVPVVFMARYVMILRRAISISNIQFLCTRVLFYFSGLFGLLWLFGLRSLSFQIILKHFLGHKPCRMLTRTMSRDDLVAVLNFCIYCKVDFTCRFLLYSQFEHNLSMWPFFRYIKKS